eukprot:1004961-Prymnesium_polylepis.2
MHPHHLFCVAVLARQIFAVGGLNAADDGIDTVERDDPETAVQLYKHVRTARSARPRSRTTAWVCGRTGGPSDAAL